MRMNSEKRFDINILDEVHPFFAAFTDWTVSARVLGPTQAEFT
jgi:hypothetical protein